MFCMSVIVLLVGLLIFGCVLHVFCRFADIWVCVPWVLSFCSYLVVCCIFVIGLLIFGCVLYGSYRFVDI